MSKSPIAHLGRTGFDRSWCLGKHATAVNIRLTNCFQHRDAEKSEFTFNDAVALVESAVLEPAA